MAAFSQQVHFTLNSLLQGFLCEYTVSDKVVRHSLAYLFVQKWFVGGVLFYVKIWPKLTDAIHKCRFSINIRS